MNTFPKAEKLVSHALIDRLFNRGGEKVMPVDGTTPTGRSISLSAFPLRLVYMFLTEEEARSTTIDSREHLPQQVLISVPKRYFHHAVDRNHVKRQVREAYRQHRDLFQVPEGYRLFLAFIYQDSNLHSSKEIERKVVNLLKRVNP